MSRNIGPRTEHEYFEYKHGGYYTSWKRRIGTEFFTFFKAVWADGSSTISVMEGDSSNTIHEWEFHAS